MEIRVYTPTLDYMGSIENHTSLIWTRKYFEPGTFEIHAPITPKNQRLLQAGNIITKRGSVEAGVIGDIENEESDIKNEATRKGRFLSAYLDWRLIRDTVNFSGKVEVGMRQLVAGVLPIPLLQLGALQGFPETVEFQVTMKQLDIYLTKLAKSISSESILGRELPHNSDAEEGVIAAIILDASETVLNTCIASKLREDYFYLARNRKIFAAILELSSEGKAIDEIVLSDKLQSRQELDEVGGIAEILRIAGRIDTYANFKNWLDIVREKYFLRSLIVSCYETIENANANTESLDAFLEKVESRIMGISQDRVSTSAHRISETVDQSIGEIDKLIKNRGQISGIPTGFTKLDEMLQGLHETEMIVVAGRPGTGKTSIALNIAENAVFSKKNPVPTLVFSLEMGAKQLVMRMLCSRAGVNQQKLRQGFALQNDMQEIYTAGKELKNAPLWIDDSSDMNVLEMRAKARRMKQQYGIGLIIVDYLQLLKGTDNRLQREQQVAEMSRGMKAMAKELNLPVIVLAQLNRESEKDENSEPKASQLRESGAIEQDADVILLLDWKRLTKEEMANLGGDQRLVNLIIAKQRNGPTGKVELMFNRNLTKYANYKKGGGRDNEHF